ncbi:MAG: LuxR C-terminal-related transcriptional regulator [Hespellia sp.]|nr:LuxR C-terminal-related transcriptional regulator [Hespellia sp.]
MTTIAYFLFSVLMILICGLPVAPTLFCYLKDRKNKIFLYLTLLFLCYLIELILLHYVLVLNMGNTITSTVSDISCPGLKIVVAMSILLLDFLFLVHILELKFQYRYLLLFLPAFITYIYTAFFSSRSTFDIWLFYSIRQFYRFFYCALFAYYFNKARHTPRFEKISPYVFPMCAIFFLNCSILIEDSLMISHLATMLFESPLMAERNFSESLLWAFFSIYALCACSRNVRCSGAACEDISREELPSTEPSVAILSSSFALFDNLPLITSVYKFTPREVEILKYLISYKSNTEISEELCISIGTTKTHIHNIYSKVNVKSKNGLIQALIACVTEHKNKDVS